MAFRVTDRMAVTSVQSDAVAADLTGQWSSETGLQLKRFATRAEHCVDCGRDRPEPGILRRPSTLNPVGAGLFRARAAEWSV